MSSSAFSKFLNPEEITRGISEVRKLAKDQAIEIALAGGAAMQLYGSDRLTKDVDFVADDYISQDSFDRDTIKNISFGGVKGLIDGVPIDVIVREDDFRDLYLDAVENAKLHPELKIKVVSPEHLAAMKLVAGRQKDEGDLNFLLQSGEVDLPKARALIRRLLGAYAVKDFNSYVDEAEWRKSHDKDE